MHIHSHAYTRLKVLTGLLAKGQSQESDKSFFREMKTSHIQLNQNHQILFLHCLYRLLFIPLFFLFIFGVRHKVRKKKSVRASISTSGSLIDQKKLIQFLEWEDYVLMVTGCRDLTPGFNQLLTNYYAAPVLPCNVYLHIFPFSINTFQHTVLMANISSWVCTSALPTSRVCFCILKAAGSQLVPTTMATVRRESTACCCTSNLNTSASCTCHCENPLSSNALNVSSPVDKSSLESP